MKIERFSDHHPNFTWKQFWQYWNIKNYCLLTKFWRLHKKKISYHHQNFTWNHNSQINFSKNGKIATLTKFWRLSTHCGNHIKQYKAVWLRSLYWGQCYQFGIFRKETKNSEKKLPHFEDLLTIKNCIDLTVCCSNCRELDFTKFHKYFIADNFQLDFTKFTLSPLPTCMK